MKNDGKDKPKGLTRDKVYEFVKEHGGADIIDLRFSLDKETVYGKYRLLLILNALERDGKVKYDGNKRKWVLNEMP